MITAEKTSSTNVLELEITPAEMSVEILSRNVAIADEKACVFERSKSEENVGPSRGQLSVSW